MHDDLSRPAGPVRAPFNMKLAYTSNPMRPGTHVIVVRSDDPLLPVGAVGRITGPYQPMLVTDPDGVIRTAWVYPCDFPRHPPRPGGTGWCGLHGSIVPLTPPGPAGRTERDDAPLPQRAAAVAAVASAQPCGTCFTRRDPART